MTDAVLWDIDGTLLDFNAAERVGIRSAFEAFGLGMCTDEMLSIYARINEKYWKMLERGACTKHETMTWRFREFFELYGMDADIEAFNDYYQDKLPETIVFTPGAWETVTALRHSFRQFCITNGNLPVQKRKLRDSGLDRIFERSFISDEVGFEKPSPHFFEYVLNAIDCKPENAIVIGDSLTSDIRGAMNAGIPCCWYQPNAVEVPSGYVVDYVIHDLREVLTILNNR